MQPAAPPNRYQELEHLGSLRDRGYITADEFEARKRQLLGPGITAANTSFPAIQPPDPNAACWHFALRDGSHQGPVSVQELRTLVRQGRLPLDSLVWTDGMPEWTPLSRTSVMTV